MRWLPRLLSHAAAAGRIPATSHGFASAGRGRGGAPDLGAGAVAEGTVRPEEPVKRPDAAAKRSRRPTVAEAVVRSEEPKKRRDAAAKGPTRRRAVSSGGAVVSLGLGGLASAACSFVNSKVAALRGQMARAWWTAGKGDAPSASRWRGEELDLARLQARLNPLLSRANLIITRRVEWANIMFGSQQETRYIIKDPRTPRRKTPVGLIREKSNFILRQVRRPFRWINSSISAEVDGREIGVVHSRWHHGCRIYDLYLGNRQFAMVENPGFWDWTFTLIDENGNVVAKIVRKPRGTGLEVFTHANQYAIQFGVVGESYRFVPEDMDKIHTFLPLALPERAVALALVVSLDRDYFSWTLWRIRAILDSPISYYPDIDL